MARVSKSRHDLEETILQKALTDDAFRAELLTNAKSAVERALSEDSPGAKLPANLAINVIEEAPNTLTLVVPMTTELSDQQLEAVSGGLKIKAKIDIGQTEPTE